MVPTVAPGLGSDGGSRNPGQRKRRACGWEERSRRRDRVRDRGERRLQAEAYRLLAGADGGNISPEKGYELAKGGAGRGAREAAAVVDS